jgi:aryl-alcohol dehydrogenase-like predicted oxidoreductase
VSAIGLGGMRLSFPGRPPENVAQRVIHAALDRGITLIDTAISYGIDEAEHGHNERLIAKALKTWSGPCEAIVVATKGGIRGGSGHGTRDGRPEHLREACEHSLRSLAVDRITLYQLHAPDPKVPFVESVGALADLQRTGKIRFVGLSNVSLEQLRIAETVVPVATVQNRLNPFFQSDRSNGVLDYCRDRGIGYLAYSPVGGWLHEQLRQDATLGAIARRCDVSLTAVVLAWLLSLAPNVIPIPSARAEPHVHDWVKGPELALDGKDLAAINEATFKEREPTLPQRIKSRLGHNVWLRRAYGWWRGRADSEL